jgi:hypothetical protein
MDESLGLLAKWWRHRAPILCVIFPPESLSSISLNGIITDFSRSGIVVRGEGGHLALSLMGAQLGPRTTVGPGYAGSPEDFMLQFPYGELVDLVLPCQSRMLVFREKA